MTEQLISNNDNWSKPKRFFTLLVIFYLLLYMFPFPFDCPLELIPPFIRSLSGYYDQAIDLVSFWASKYILHIDNLVKTRGESIFGYVQLFSIAFLSAIISFLVVLIDKNRKNYDRQFHWTNVYARYYVGFYIIYYGSAKLTGVQFPTPGPIRLEQTFGDASPMVLLWTFMGYSKAYALFAGIIEILGGYLLLFNRTKAIGALIVIAVMSNVVMMNFSYDVSVKIVSTHLLLITIFIFSPNMKKVIDFFFFQKTVALTRATNQFNKKWMRTSRVVLKSIIIIGFSSEMIFDNVQQMNEYGSLAPKSPLYGVYQTENFIINNDTTIALTTDTVRWKKMMIDEHSYTKIITMVDSSKLYKTAIDTIKKTLKLTAYEDTVSYQFAYTEKPPNYLTLSGMWKGNNVVITFKKKQMENYRLADRGFPGFRWIKKDQFGMWFIR